MSILNRPKGLLAILSPCAIILAVRFFSSLGPSTSAAAVGTVGPSPVYGTNPVAPVVKPEQAPAQSDAAVAARLSRYITTLRQAGRVHSPMDHAPARFIAAAPVPDAIPEVPIAPDRTDLRLTATIGAGESAAALINGKILRVGDTIAGLTIVSINSAEFFVTLRTERGEEQSLRRR